MITSRSTKRRRVVASLIVLLIACSCTRASQPSVSHTLEGWIVIVPIESDKKTCNGPVAPWIGGDGTVYVVDTNQVELGAQPLDTLDYRQGGRCGVQFSFPLNGEEPYQLRLRSTSDPSSFATGPTYTAADLEASGYQVDTNFWRDFERP